MSIASFVVAMPENGRLIVGAVVAGQLALFNVYKLAEGEHMQMLVKPWALESVFQRRLVSVVTNSLTALIIMCTFVRVVLSSSYPIFI